MRTEFVERFRRPRNGQEAFINNNKLPTHSVIHTHRAGDRFHPLGAPGQKKLSDYFTDRKIPLEIRDQIPLVASGNQILFVAGYAVAESLRVGPDTKRILRIVYGEGMEDGDS